MRRPVYILVAIGGWLLNWGMYIPLFYLPPFAITAGLSPKLAPHTVAIFNAVSIFGRIFAGALADRMGCVSNILGISCSLSRSLRSCVCNSFLAPDPGLPGPNRLRCQGPGMQDSKTLPFYMALIFLHERN